jgi:hypothetical protein
MLSPLMLSPLESPDSIQSESDQAKLTERRPGSEELHATE